MWSTQSLWFEVALVMSIFAVGNILFGHFQEHQPKLRRVAKVVLVTAILVTLSATVGRAWALLFLALLLLAAAWVHLWWLPKHGVNGWTGEPKARYLELVQRKPPSRSRED